MFESPRKELEWLEQLQREVNAEVEEKTRDMSLEQIQALFDETMEKIVAGMVRPR